MIIAFLFTELLLLIKLIFSTTVVGGVETDGQFL
jgi:hypothetical protein